ELSVRSRSARYLRRGQVVYPRRGFGESGGLASGSWSGGAPASRAGHPVHGASERATVLAPGIRRGDTASPPAVLGHGDHHRRVRYGRSDLLRNPKHRARPGRLRRLLPGAGPVPRHAPHHRRPEDDFPSLRRVWRRGPQGPL
ncbi:MAG: hypothetical protein AVDCRST_MAG58-2935, partial [uncultured Rubrobacteraceae bacterium]